MKIIYISTYLPKKCGIASYTDYLIHGMREIDSALEIKVVAEEGASPIKQRTLEVIPCWNRNENYIEPILSQSRGADVIHVQHEYSIYSLDDRLPSLLQRMDPKAKKIVTVHCIRPAPFSKKGEIEEKFIARITRMADQTIVHLESQKAILERLEVPLERIHIIPHGTELSNKERTSSRRKLGLPLDGKILLMFGFIKEHKCIHIVMEALSKILEQRKDVYLFVAGGLAPAASKKDREYAERVRKKLADLSLQKNVIYPNKFFPNEEVSYLFAAADIVLFPYYEEDRSASGAFHLAIGANRPVIASRIPKFEELKNICDELLILPYNASGIARIALRLFQDKEFWQYVMERNEAYRRATSWKAIASKHLQLYGEG